MPPAPIKPDSILVVLPAYNEAATVGRVVEAVQEQGYDALVVDDGSSDSTGTEAGRAGATVLRLPVNLGVGGALRCGFRFAVERGYDTVVQCDADGQHDPGEIGRLLEALDRSGAQLVIGTRFAPDGAYQVDRSRRLVMRVLARVASRATGTTVTDATSGFRAIRSPLLEDFALTYPVEYLGDTVEALVRAGDSGYRVVEEPTRMSYRADGAPSASSLASLWYLVRVVAAIALRRRTTRRRPPALPSTRGVLP